MNSRSDLVPLGSWLGAWTRVSLALGLVATVLPLGFIVSKVLSMRGHLAFVTLFFSAAGQTLILNTVGLALTVAAVGTTLGTISAFAIMVLPLPGKIWWHKGLLLPSLMGPFIVPVILIVAIGRAGFLFSGYYLLGFDLYGFLGIAICQILSFTPTAYLIILAALRTVNPQLLAGFATLGVSRYQVLRAVVFPALRQPIGQTFLILMVESAADLATPLVLGGKYQVLTAALYSQAVSANSLGTASVYALVLAVFSLGVISLTRSITPPIAALYSSGWFPTQGWRSYLTPPRPVAFFLAFIILGQALLGWLVTIGLGGVVLNTVWKWLSPAETEGISVVSWLGPLNNSFLLATLAMPLIVMLALGLSLAQPKRRTARILYVVTRVSLQLPSSVLTFGLLCAFAKPWRFGDFQVFPALVGGTSWGGGAIAIVIAYALRCLNLAINIIEIDLRRLNPVWWEVSSSLGVNESRQQQEILIPNLQVAITRAAGLSFLTAISSLSTVAFLPSTSWEVLTMSMLAQMDGANYAQLFASSMILFLITAGSQLLSTQLRRRQHRTIGAIIPPGKGKHD